MTPILNSVYQIPAFVEFFLSCSRMSVGMMGMLEMFVASWASTERPFPALDKILEHIRKCQLTACTCLA